MARIYDLPIKAIELATTDAKRPTWCPFKETCLLVERLDENVDGERYETDDGPTDTCVGAWFPNDPDEGVYIRECSMPENGDQPQCGIMSLAFITHYIAALTRAMWRASDINYLRVNNEDD